ncbi:MarR family winged helix-turn-helix transcriptional regulator [Protaetiibacter intestinalis]|uniref:MarR family transcriptional regulator n=1 Tax=Protaetiibacter intestinalis TaxID=2419774 RepID=A0A387B806_9MICO|nr:MarR family winged helix-turn-helix transcriptional regulator [Protaetiibacter intestinalis]AYF97941.1 MarR family transcriptional regulator [Protaetiibacter intestinalis]
MSTTSGVSAEHWDVWREYYGAGRALTHAFDSRLQADAGISHPEYSVLVVLWSAPHRKLRTGELADALSWEKSRVSHQVTRMVARGLVERTTCETDGRGVWVGLTPEGSRVFLASTRDHTAAIRSWFFDVLTPEELRVIRDVSRRIREQLIADGAAPLPREREAEADDAA